ncbi:phosphoglycerate kinase [Methanosarcinales archaeon]|nr:MAG: phosphoglycerate kinase [Methanosarcinales archaeon]
MPDLKMAPVGKRLKELLNQEVLVLDDCIGEEVKKAIDSSASKIILLENLRFHPEEESCDEKFSKELASLADVYVNDAFGTSHRKHASVWGVAKFTKVVAGLLLEKEIEYLGKILSNPKKPYMAILGGAKVSDKIEVIKNLMKNVDVFLVGGGMSYTFLKALGQPIGKSKLEEDKIQIASQILQEAREKGIEIYLPEDHVVVKDINQPSGKKIVQQISEDEIAVDIGPATIEKFCSKLQEANTILWNGPLGIFEIEEYAQGTKSIAEKVAQLTQKGVVSVIGGGDTAASISKFGLENKMSHVSTGGGASLEFMEGKILPGIEVLENK